MTTTLEHSESKPKPNPWTPALLAAAFLMFLAYLLRYVLLPFIIAGGLAFICSPVVRWLQSRWKFPRWLAVLVPFVLFLGFLALIGLGVYFYALPEVKSVLSNEGPMLDRITGKVLGNRTIDIGGKRYDAHQIATALQNSAASIVNPSHAIQDLTVVFGMIMGGVLTIVLLFYFLLDASRIARGLMWVVPPRIRPQAAAVGRRAGPMIFSYVRGVIIVVCYATLLTFLVARFLLHIHESVVLAIAVGLLEMIPVIGPMISIALIVIAAVQRITFWGMVGAAIFAAGLRISIDQFIGPVVLGRFVRVSPPLVIFAFLAGGTVFGVMGVVVAVPVAAIIKITLEEAYKEQDEDWPNLAADE